MRLFKLLLLSILLSACSLNGGESLDDIFSNTSASKARANNYADYVDYYCPSDIHEIEADKISTVFELNDGKIIMNVNIAGIINGQYHSSLSLSDDGFFDEDKLVYNKEGFYYDDENNEIPYFFNLYQYDDVYLLHLVNQYINIYAYTNEKDLTLMASKIYDLLKSIDVDSNAVLLNFSTRDVIEYSKSTANLFEEVMPVEGRIDDMMIGNDDIVSDD